MERDCVALDGTLGGGQVLRTALSLALVTQRPFHLRNARAGRSPPGLRAPHLAYVRAAEALGGTSEGAGVGSPQLLFRPSPVRSGDHLVEVGSGASATLVWQCLFFPLALAGGGELTLRGGTHLGSSPSYPYLRWVWLAGVAAFGFRASFFLRYAGFAPEAAGEFRGIIPPPLAPPERVTLPARGTLRDVDVTSFVAGLPWEVADRQARAAVLALRERGIYSSAENMPLPVTRSSGLSLFIRAQFEHTCAGFTAIGERSASPDDVGRAAVLEFAQFMEGTGALDAHLSNQILLPAALLAAGVLGAVSPGETRFSTVRVDEHLRSTARVLEAFLPVRIQVDEASGEVQVRRAEG